MSRRSAVLQLAVLRHEFEVANTAEDIGVVGSGLEVGHAALASPGLEGGGNFLVFLHDGLLDGGIKDGRERCSGVEEVTAESGVEVILAHAEQRGSLLAVTGQALDGDVTEAHAAELFSTFSRLFGFIAHTHTDAVNGSGTELVLAGFHYTDTACVDGSVSLLEFLQNSLAAVIHGSVAVEVGLRVNPKVATQCGDFRLALSLVGYGSANGLVIAFLALLAVLLGGIDFGLEFVELTGLIGGQITVLGTSQRSDFALTSNHLLNVHIVLSSLKIIFVCFDLRLKCSEALRFRLAFVTAAPTDTDRGVCRN